MGDISREPLPGGARSKGRALKGPAEVIRLDDLTVEERSDMDETRSGTEGPDDPAARAFPSPRLAPAAPMRIEPFGPASGRDGEAELPDGPGELSAEDAPVPVDEALSVEEAIVEDLEAAPTAEVPAGVEPMEADGSQAGPYDADALELAELLAEGEPEPQQEAAELDAPAADDVEAHAVPTVDELVDDSDAVPAQAEPLRESSLSEDSDDAPPLTDPEEVGRVLLAVLLSAREPLSLVRMAEVCNSTQKVVEAGLRALDAELRQRGLPLEIVQMGDGVRVSTSPTVYPYLTRLKKLKPVEKLSPAALETLAVIAYRQPVIRLEVEAIRGVKVGPMLQSLLQHKLIRVVGRADVPGKPLQYGTTQHFLERFGLRSLKDLPSIQEFRALG
jgi:segregation and condensation protein B